MKLHIMTHLWNYQVTICSILITFPIIKEEVFAFIINRPFFYEFWIFQISMNVSTLKSVLQTTLVILSNSADIPVKSRTSFKLLKQIYKWILMHYQLEILSFQLWTVISMQNNSWYLNDITSFEGSQIEFFASQCAIFQVIKELTFFRWF